MHAVKRETDPPTARVEQRGQKTLHASRTFFGGWMGDLEQVVAPRHDGQNVRLRAAQRLDRHINPPDTLGDRPAIFSLVADLPDIFL